MSALSWVASNWFLISVDFCHEYGVKRRVDSMAIYKGWGVSGGEETICIWNLTTLNPVFEIRFNSNVNGLVADEEAIYVGCAYGMICLELNL